MDGWIGGSFWLTWKGCDREKRTKNSVYKNLDALDGIIINWILAPLSLPDWLLKTRSRMLADVLSAVALLLSCISFGGGKMFPLLSVRGCASRLDTRIECLTFVKTFSLLLGLLVVLCSPHCWMKWDQCWSRIIITHMYIHYSHDNKSSFSMQYLKYYMEAGIVYEWPTDRPTPESA